MTNKPLVPGVNRIAVFLALFYAFSTRTVIAPMIFRGGVSWLYYGVMYLTLGICLANRFVYDGLRLYAPKRLFTTMLLFLVIAFGLYRSGAFSNIRYYGIALLLPFALSPHMKKSRTFSIAFVSIGVVLFIGCLINYSFPAVYRSVILPRFSESVQSGLNWQAGFGTYFPGFTSQVGYTSFFISIAFGALFCFRKNIYKQWFVPLAVILFMGMLFTGKRGPAIFLPLSLFAVYFCESRGRERFVRAFQIALIAAAAYAALFLLAAYTRIPGIERIFDSIRELVFTRDIEDSGRSQLGNQALVYFSDHMLFGIGWNNFKTLFTLRRTHVHNIYLQLLCETGIVGFMLFMFFFANNMIHTLQKIKLADAATYECSWLMMSLFIQIYFLLYGISGNPLYDIEEAILYFFAAGIGGLPMLEDVPHAESGAG